jgi:broad specificity phosphatase PhoE
VVCVAHGGPIRCALAIALGIDMVRAVAFSVRNLSVTRIEALPATCDEAPRWRVRGVGEIPG